VFAKIGFFKNAKYFPVFFYHFFGLLKPFEMLLIASDLRYKNEYWHEKRNMKCGKWDSQSDKN
jgi:hypothetical protein